ncbi:MAG: hypothetical protein WDN69_04020 [Aliidongia sp.]
MAGLAARSGVEHLALAIYFSHIAAFGVYVLLLAGTEIAPVFGLVRRLSWRALAGRLTSTGAQFVLPLAIVLAGWGKSAGGVIEYGNPLAQDRSAVQRLRQLRPFVRTRLLRPLHPAITDACAAQAARPRAGDTLAADTGHRGPISHCRASS